MKVLIVDDEKNIRELMGTYLKLDAIESEGAENGLSAQRLLRENHYDACLVDLKMPGMDGLSLIKWIRNEGFRMPVIMISAHGEIHDAVAALTSGAQDYIVKPFDPEELSIRLVKLIESQNLQNLVESGQRTQTGTGKLIGESRPIQKIKKIINKIAETPATVLITGESGTGKEVAARQIHAVSLLCEGPFVAINIGGVPENLIESELFGYEKGAFTGAESRKIGMFELASGGTLFLDEIGDMSLSLQVKLLRVLQEKKITHLGGTTTIPINARIITATNKSLETMIREGSFREDLFYRLNVVRIEIPTLRDRKEDIPLLAGSIIARLNRQMGSSNRIEGVTPEGIQHLKEYSFPGNIRELENVLERAAIFAEQSMLGEDDFELRGIVLHEQNVLPGKPTDLDQNNTEPKTLKKIEEEAMIQALHRWEGNRTKAAGELGISRRTLINKIAEYGLNI